MADQLKSVAAAHESFATSAQSEAASMLNAATAKFPAIGMVQLGYDPLFGEAAAAGEIHRKAAADLVAVLGKAGPGMLFLGEGARVAGLTLQSTDATSSLSVRDVTTMLGKGPAGKQQPPARAVQAANGDVVGFDYNGDGRVDHKLDGTAQAGDGTGDPAGGRADSPADARMAQDRESPFEVPSEHPGWVDLTPRTR